jgi:multiple sugar transport system permease protein
MPILGKVGRKSWATRATVTGIHVVLLIGSIVTVYPFLLMLSTSVTSSTDVEAFRPIPRYLTDHNALFGKVADEKYAGDISAINSDYGTDFATLQAVIATTERPHETQLFRDFLADLPSRFWTLGFRGYGHHPGLTQLNFRRAAQDRFKGDISALNKAFGEQNETFLTVSLPPERPTARDWAWTGTPKEAFYQGFRDNAPVNKRVVVWVDPLFRRWLQAERYVGRPEKLEQVWGPVEFVQLSTGRPALPEQGADWELYVRTRLPLRFVRPTDRSQAAFRQWMAAKYRGVTALNRLAGAQYRSWQEIAVPTGEQAGVLLRDWGEFVATAASLETVQIDSADNRWRAVAGPLPPPIYAFDSDTVMRSVGSLRWDYATRNYRHVFDFLAIQGRAVVVTIVYCALVVLVAVTVNPLCAYALSRHNLKRGHQILIFLLATMAFPAEVVMIPNFLLLRDLGLLNTFWALILPTAASGFAIFLLKGFFDSLPSELFEAAKLDGAGEVQMFRIITIPLSRPVLAVISLEAFIAAYGAFLFAMLVCQDRSMWTIMVWLYQLQQTSPQYITMAALVLAAIPTLLIYMLAQKSILRGIVVPIEK